MSLSAIQSKIKVALATKFRRSIFVIGVHFVALVISWLNLVRIYPEGPIPFLETIGTSLFLGFMALPLSAGHLLQNLGPDAIMPVGGRPGLFFLELVISLTVFCSFLFFILKGNKTAGLTASMYMLLAAPYWGYYSFALMGI
jgi:hypothetical protein